MNEVKVVKNKNYVKKKLIRMVIIIGKYPFCRQEYGFFIQGHGAT